MPDSPRIEELKRRVQSDPASIAFAALAEEYRRTGRYQEAIGICRTGLQRHPSYISAHVTLGRALLEVGQYDDARAELEYVLSVAPENLAAIRGLAEIHHRQDQSADGSDLTATALADMARLLQPNPPAAPKEPTRAPTPPAAGMRPPIVATPPQVVETPPPLVETLPAIEPAPAVESRPPIQVRSIIEPPAATHAPPPAEAPPGVDARPAPAPRKEDPALAGLEAFLQAILRARETARDVHAP